jgi:hypothetical protein
MICSSTYLEFNIQREALFYDSMFEIQWSILESMIHHPTLPIVNCILDGLDEYEPTSLEWLLIKLHRLFARTAASTHTGQSPTATRYPNAEGMSSPEEARPRLRVLGLSRAKTPRCLDVLFRYKHLALDDYWKNCEGGVARFVEHSFKQAHIDVQLAIRLDVPNLLDRKRRIF